MTTLFDSRHALLSLAPDGVATLVLRDAKSLNILGAAAIAHLTAALAVVAANTEVRLLVLRGSGDKAFIGGADIHEMSALTPTSAERFITDLKDLCEALRGLGVPVIARLCGWCLGAGLEVAAACDLRLSSLDARYGMPEVHVGIPSVIHAALLPRLIGASRAHWMLMTGEAIDARTALDWGLVHALHEPAMLDPAMAELAGKLLRLGPAVLRQQKRLLTSWQELSLQEAVAASVPEFGQAFATGEPQRYMQAFIDRPRGPKATGP
jgi:enoyl-CoA hydratase